MKLEIIGIAIDSHSLVFEKKSKSLLRPREKKKRRRRCKIGLVWKKTFRRSPKSRSCWKNLFWKKNKRSRFVNL